MIPERITVEGFLCYRTAQTVDFAGAALWMLAGANGTGKSTIFDAITFALFGHHRGGQKNARELITKGSDRLLVEFDFLHEEQRYQARRTVRRKGSPASTWQMRRWRGADTAGDFGWEEIPDTSSEAGFDRWVRNHLGLTYETFTSSVLLLQGKADNLLAAMPARRFEVLAGVVGLDRYQKLHERVEARRKEFLHQSKTLLQQLNGVRVVEDAELEEADQAIVAADGARRLAQAEVERLQVLEFQATRWVDLQAALAEVGRQWQAMQQLLADAETIERNWSRLCELRENLPRLADLVAQHDRIDASQRESERLTAERARVAGQIEQLDYGIEQVRQKRQVLEQAHTDEEQNRARLAEQRQVLSAALPLLRQLQGARAQLEEAGRLARTASQNAEEASARLIPLEAERASLAAGWQAAIQTREQADHAVTRTRTLLDEVTQRSERFFSVVGEKMCRYCGQALTPGHIETERAKLAKERAEAEAQHRQALGSREAAVSTQEQLASDLRDLERRLDEGQRQADDWRARQRDAERDTQHYTAACARAYGDLAEPWRTRVSPMPPADWLALSFPSEDELKTLEASRSDLEAQAADLQARWEARRQELAAAREELDRLGQERDELGSLLAETDRRLNEERARCEAGQEILVRIRGELSPDWRRQAENGTLAHDVSHWQAEQQALEREGVEAQADELRRARASADSVERHKRDLERDQDLFPPDARQDPEQVHRLVVAARDAQALHEETLRQAHEHKALLVLARTQRQQLQDQFLAAEGQHKLYQKLADLLGRDRLQLHLLRHAERGIVQYANAVLGRLSGGELYLRLCGSGNGEDAAEKALQLEALSRAAGHEPIRVEFLSGSQRFRVAVSLALGIGQYASRRQRPVESVIIDEGFGCLDKANRQVMIQELQNLRGQLRRILVVSHQEEFAAAFPDGYHFELVDGTTEVSRFQSRALIQPPWLAAGSLLGGVDFWSAVTRSHPSRSARAT
jgi:DNA repair exonuclease SbcCD ATPase subunit